MSADGGALFRAPTASSTPGITWMAAVAAALLVADPHH
jgi:hypothetical protein